MTATLRKSLVTKLLNLFRAQKSTKNLLRANANLIDNNLLWALVRGYDSNEIGYINMILTLSQYPAIKLFPGLDLNLLKHIYLALSSRKKSVKNLPLSIEKVVELPSVKSLNDLTEFFKEDKANYEKFRGSFTMEWGWLMWLQKRYGKKLVCVWEGTRGRGGILYSWRGTKKWRKGINIEPWFLNHLKECLDTNSRFVVGILSMKVKRGYHANAFIFDLKNQTVSRFEPNGGQATNYYNYKAVNSTLDTFFKSKGTVNKIGEWKYESPSDFCPVGPQVKAAKYFYEKKVGKVYGRQVVVEAGGFCAVWALMFVHYKLINPDYNDQEIIKWLLELSSEKLSNMAREYAAFIVNNINHHWDSKEANDRLDVGDIVEFKRGRNIFTGVLVKKLVKKALVLFDRPPVKRRTGPSVTLTLVPVTHLRLAENIDTSKIKAECQNYLKTYRTGKYTAPIKSACERL